MKLFNSPIGYIVLAHVQLVEPVRKTGNGFAFDVHLSGYVCNLAFNSEADANYGFDELIEVLQENIS